MDNTSRFYGIAEIYSKSRSDYAAAFFYYLKNTLHIPEGSVFSDVGSGTGIFSKQLLDAGYKVYAVEPNADMRKIAEEQLSERKGFSSVIGTEKNTSLPDSFVDAVSAAQAFHWFDADAFKTECRRILKPNGRVIIIYNSRDKSAESTKMLAEIRHKYNPEFHGFSNGISEEKCISFFDGNCKIFRADNSITYDRQGYIGRALSSSYSPREGDENYEKYIAEINNIFDTFSADGKLTVPISTTAYTGAL